MSQLLLRGAWMVAVWIALWAELTPANLLSGVVVAGTLLAAFPSRYAADRRGHLRPLATLRFLGYFAWKLVEASAIVAWEVVTPRNRIVEGIVAVPLRGVSDGVTTIVANAISLVPGTLTLEVGVDPVVLYVHVLHLHDRAAVVDEVLRLEELAARAVGLADALDRRPPPGRAGTEPVPAHRPPGEHR